MTEKVDEALAILTDLGFPRAQLNERSALCLLAILDLKPNDGWSQANDPLIGITPIMDWLRVNYDKVYAPNSRETIRRQTMHQFVEAGLALYNPDQPSRAVNSPKVVYQVSPSALELLCLWGSDSWKPQLVKYLKAQTGLAERYASERILALIPVTTSDGKDFTLSPGAHSELIRDVIEKFAPRFARGAKLIYAGDTGAKADFFDVDALAALGVTVNKHGKMPDVVLHYTERNWLLLVEAVTSHGPVDGKRHIELRELFKDCKIGLVFVTAFPDRREFSRYITEIAWETEVWVADAPSHLVHFNGERFLGPYELPK